MDFSRETHPLPTLIDTDPALMVRLGLDIDDDLALLCALGSPELALKGITITYGNTSVDKAHKDACRLLDLASRGDIPVRKGAGWLTRDINKTTDASRFIVDQLRRSERGLVIVTLGPLTNLAAALTSAPDVVDRIRMHLALGGRLISGRIEFNFSAHPEATQYVLRMPIPRVIVPIEVCTSVVFGHKELHTIEDHPGTVVYSLRGHIRRFMRRKEVIIPLLAPLRRTSLTERGFHPWDVVALAYLIQPQIFSDLRPLTFWMDGIRVMNTPAPAHGSVLAAHVPHRVDAQALLCLMMDRLLRTRANAKSL